MVTGPDRQNRIKPAQKATTTRQTAPSARLVTIVFRKRSQRVVQCCHFPTGEGFFRPINRHDRVVTDVALTPQSVAQIVKSAVGKFKGVDAAKLVVSHSLRAGFVTEAAMVGMQTSAIMGQNGHKSLEVVHQYVRQLQNRQIQSLLSCTAGLKRTIYPICSTESKLG